MIPKFGKTVSQTIVNQELSVLQYTSPKDIVLHNHSARVKFRKRNPETNLNVLRLLKFHWLFQ